MYLDVEKKIEFYKNNIIKEFIKLGIYPKDDLINSELTNIDLGLSVFKAKKIHPGDYFNSDSYNNQLELIYQDLKILYELLYELTIKQFNELKAYTECHLNELEEKTRMYKLRSDQELNSTLLGKTILFQSDSFKFDTINNIKIIDLGRFKVHKGAQLACILDAANIEANKTIFEIHNNNLDLRSNVYNFNQDFIVIPGQLKQSFYRYSILPNQKVDYPIAIDIDNVPNFKNNYCILGGQNKISVKEEKENNVKNDIVDKANFTGKRLNEKTYIDFYVFNGDTITFNFNKNPISTNFKTDKNSQVTNLNQLHHFFIEADKGFTFDFTINKGEIFAVKSKGIVKNKKLYCTLLNINDFLVIEEESGDEIEVKGQLLIVNDNGSPIEMKYVAVKELIKFGGEL